MAKFAFLWGLGATYAVHLKLIGKLVVDLLLVVIELFSLDVWVEAVRANIHWKSPFLKPLGQFGPKFQVEGASPTNSHDIKMSVEISFVLSQCTRLTDRQTHGQTARPLCDQKDRVAYNAAR